MKAKLFIISAFLLVFTAYTYAGTFSTIEWVDDSSITLDAAKMYTHAIDYAAAEGTVVINGVTVTQFPMPGGWGTIPPQSGTDSVTGNSWTQVSTNNHTGTAATPADGENSAILKTAFLYGGSVQSITLDGLTPGVNYRFTWYGAGWNAVDRIGIFDGLDDGEGTETIEVNCNTDLPAFILQYDYIASDTSFTMQITSPDTGNSIHNYAWTNELNVLPSTAYAPAPADGETDVRRNVTLTWSAGLTAATHDVFIGKDYDAVAAASADNVPAGVTGVVGLAEASLMPALQYGTTYYWKVNEVNDLDPNSPYEGDVWGFTTEFVAYPIPAENITVSASSYAAGQDPINTINGSGLADGLHSNAISDMWASAMGDPCAWIQYDFDQAYKIYSIEVWNYNGFEFLATVAMKDVTIEYSLDGVNFTRTDAVTELPQTAGAPGLEALTIVPSEPDDANSIIAKSIKISASSNWGGGALPQTGLSEVIISYKAVLPIEPDPASGTEGLYPEVTLSFVPGKEAGKHILYLSEDVNAVTDCNTAVVDPIVLDEASYTANLPMGQYYWKIIEVNDAESPTEWAGPVWDFATVDYIVVDDMESYTDEQGERMSNTYRGYNGASVGYPDPNLEGGEHYAETVIAHDQSDQSMPFFFDTRNTAGKSYISVNPGDLDCDSDWTIGHPDTLVFWMYGDADNVDTETMYVKFNGVRYNVEIDPSDVLKERWIMATVDLNQTANQVDLSNVTSLEIGFSSETVNEGAGQLLIDNIRLYNGAPLAVVPVDPGDANLVGHWKLDDGAGEIAVDSSVLGRDGTIVGDSIWYDDAERGMVAHFASSSAIDCGAIMPVLGLDTDFSWACWTRREGGGTNDVVMGNRYGGEPTPPNGEFVKLTNGAFEFYKGGGGVGNVDFDNLPSGGPWVHHVISKQGTIMTYYRDGEELGAAAVTDVVTPIVFYIGGDLGRGSISEGFDGWISDVRIYDDALTPGEALFIYAATK